MSTSAAPLPSLWDHDPPARPATAPGATRAPIPVPDPGGRPTVDVVVPVFNEQVGPRAERPAPARLPGDARFPLSARITIADNASTDDTAAIARARWPPSCRGCGVVRLEAEGARARPAGGLGAAATPPVLAYMDVDLSTDLAALLPAGRAAALRPQRPRDRHPARPRLAGGARPQARDHLPRATTCCCATLLGARFSDAQCGFKAIRARRARGGCCRWCEDTGWFFDTELLVLAERAGLRIHEVPVDWVDDPDCRVDVVAHRARPTCAGVWRLGRGLAPGALPLAAARPWRLRDRAVAARPSAWPASCSASRGRRASAPWPTSRSTCCCRGSAGRRPANALALLLTAVANTAANRRFTFGVRGRRRRGPPPGCRASVVFALGLALTSGVARAPARRQRRRRPGARGGRPRRRQPRGHRCCASSCCAAGSSARRRAAADRHRPRPENPSP